MGWESSGRSGFRRNPALEPVCWLFQDLRWYWFLIANNFGRVCGWARPFCRSSGSAVEKKWSQCFWRKTEQQTLDLNLQSLAHTSCRISLGNLAGFWNGTCLEIWNVQLPTLPWSLLQWMSCQTRSLLHLMHRLHRVLQKTSRLLYRVLHKNNQLMHWVLSQKDKLKEKLKQKQRPKERERPNHRPKKRTTNRRWRPNRLWSDPPPLPLHPQTKATAMMKNHQWRSLLLPKVVHRGVWTNIDMLEMEFGVSKCRKSKSSGWARGWKQMQIPCVGVRCFVILKSFCPWNSVKSFCPWKVKPAEFVSPAELEEIAVPHPKLALPQISSLSWFSLIELSGLNKFTL